jgi:hypothetical protein
VNAATTPASLIGGKTSCESDFDSSAYWMSQETERRG